MLVALHRVARKSRALGQGRATRALRQSGAFQSHLSTDPVRDPLFYLAHRFYLARGLTAAERAQAALYHYTYDDAQFDTHYAAQVYGGTGLILWHATVAGVTYDIRLLPGNDVVYEGGLSVVLHVDGGRICVLSFSVVSRQLVLSDLAHDLADAIIFVTRKQLTAVRDYQAAFNAAFDRCTPAHLCFGAISGIALAQGQHFAFGIAPDKHPSFAPERATQFQKAYGDFWLSVSGRKLSPLGYLIDLPMQLTSLDALDPPRRKRALARRAHIDAVVAASTATIAPRLHMG